ncbi:hypothetical protein AAFC00_004044 [Neodothiora populina]|uniref:Carboxylic ester hydrolase n=1 Tax=Neodothiora populina TaxID=2781224 RepID=A0ABR3PIL7_9PEZI
MQISYAALFLLSSTAVAIPSWSRLRTRAPNGSPVVSLQNGSYYGLHNSNYNQDFFLGIPFAQPPLENLRFANPKPLERTWYGALPATEYAFECIGYGGDQIGYQQSEDCLYLNLVRPAGYENATLPVAVWIHGGGFFEGGTPDRRYNLTFIVENSVKIGKPIMAASIAYRLGPFGFLNGNEINSTGLANIGLKDQRLALHWIQENIASFGGDAFQVTIWGESAGAESVGFHLVAYNGRDDKLFRGAIMESGSSISSGGLRGSDFYQPRYDSLVKTTGCSNDSDSLDCLRKVPFTVLNNALNTTEFNSGWKPTIDGDIIAKHTSIQIADGEFVHVPIIIGANTDEGTAFAPKGVNTSAELRSTMELTTAGNYPELIDELMDIYTRDDPEYSIPSSESLGGNVTLLDPYGAYYRHAAAYYGDYVFIASRRRTCQTWAAADLRAYCYRFNVIPSGSDWPYQATHFTEVAFVFNNVDGT